ncbi:MAG TPA: regulatory protein RecX [Gammaproteobacteria bacterium]|nr:regulatory protein RecX [Gammaproteobacteria bacterium]
MTTPSKKKCYAAAMRMLVRREHSVFELTQKLTTKEFDRVDIEQTLGLLIEQNYQSDERFTADFIQMRFNQGKGPIKIAVDLRQRGINSFDLSMHDFYVLAQQIRVRKFGKQIPDDYKQQAKQKRFLQSRGFDFEQINQAFRHESISKIS